MCRCKPPSAISAVFCSFSLPSVMPPKAESQLSTEHAIAQQPRQLCLRDQARYRDPEVCFLPCYSTFVQNRLLRTLQPDLSRLVNLVAPAAGPKLMQPQQAGLASSGPAIAAACRRLRDECLGPGMRRLFLFDFACSLRVIER